MLDGGVFMSLSEQTAFEHPQDTKLKVPTVARTSK